MAREDGSQFIGDKKKVVGMVSGSQEARQAIQDMSIRSTLAKQFKQKGVMEERGSINASAEKQTATTVAGARDRTVLEINANAPVRAAQVRQANAGTENQEFTNTLAKKYGEQRLTNELDLQKKAGEKVDVESSLLAQDYDRIQNDAAMKRSTDFQQAPHIVSQNVLADWKAEQGAKSQMAPNLLTSSRGTVNEFSESVLGAPGILSSLAEKVPVLGVAERFRRLSKAKTVVAKKAGAAKP